MKDYKNLIEAVKAEVARRIPGGTVEVRQIKKNNLVRIGVVISYADESANEKIRPIVYLDDFNCKDAHEEADAAVRIVNTLIDDVGSRFSTEDILNWEWAKDRLITSVVSYENNKSFLRNLAYVKYQDMAVIFRVVLVADRADESKASCIISKKHAKLYGLTPNQLLKAAAKSPLMTNYTVQSMYEVLCQFDPELADVIPDDNPMYVISNRIRYFGAGLITSRDALEDAYQVLSGDYYILPSSVHELIAVPVDAEEPGVLRSMVCKVNTFKVAPEERLTNNVYCYKTGEDGKRYLEIVE